MKYYIIAGEASGDLHGSKLIEEIKKNDPNSEFRLWGGELMSKAGGKVVKSLDEVKNSAEIILLFRKFSF